MWLDKHQQVEDVAVAGGERGGVVGGRSHQTFILML